MNLTKKNSQEVYVSAHSEKPTGRDVAIDYLRSFIIVLVVFHHAALAYTAFSVFYKANYVTSTAPVVDIARWPLLDLFVGLNDTFFMSLLFLVSGLFAASSLAKKGPNKFFHARLKRLGLPFTIAAVTVIPLAYWPSWLLADPQTDQPFWLTFFSSDGWPSGPLWFLWVLLAFNGILALTNRIFPSMISRLWLPTSPIGIFLLTIVAYIPLTLIVHPFSWTSLGGPFDVQAARILLYFAYFLAGVVLGKGQEWRQQGWPKNWRACFLMGILAFSTNVWILLKGMDLLPTPTSRALVMGIFFAASCAGLSLGLLGFFRKYVHQTQPVMESLNSNAFGIYILHYTWITWLQYLLLEAAWPAALKFIFCFIAGLLFSWGSSHLLRKIPVVRQML